MSGKANFFIREMAYIGKKISWMLLKVSGMPVQMLALILLDVS